MSVIHAPRKPELEPRQIVMLAIPTLALVGLLLRLWYIQVVDADSYRAMAEKYRWSSVETLAPRGLIYDRHGRLIAGVKPEYVVTAIPNEVRNQPWVLDKVAGLLGADKAKLEEKVEDGMLRPYLPTPIHVGATKEVAIVIAEAGPNLPGIGVSTQPMRHYPNTTDLAHILGYVWTPDKNDVERFELHKWPLPSYVGKQGIEWSCEPDLMGKPGTETIEIDSRRKPIRVIGREQAAPGSRLILTLDRELQKYANAALEEVRSRYPSSGAALAALDPSTGEVLALASYPTFDTNLFRGGISREAYRQLDEDPLHPMFNRAVSGSYSPGSTFKVVTALGGVFAGYFDPNRHVVCRGYYEAGNRKFKCLGVHGSIAFREALARSCNAYFGDMAAHAQRKGLNQAAIALGLGYKTGIELRGESAGSLPTDKWLKKLEERSGKKAEWYLGNTINVGIGQGEVSATTLQMANVAAAVANGGVSFKPHLVKARVDAQGTHSVAPLEAHRVDSPTFWHEMQEGMKGVIDHGTARGIAIPGLVWAGKTGSTEARGNAKTHSWFIGYAPADNPKIAIAVVVEKAGHGSEVAAPIAAQVVRRYLRPPANEAQR